MHDVPHQLTEESSSAAGREIADGVYWLGGCGPRVAPSGLVMHNSVSAYLVTGSEKALLFDTGPPGHWPALEQSLDSILRARQLDWVVPSHPEVPHSGCIPQLLTKYPECIVLGDVRDYHLFYPEFANRLQPLPHSTSLDLGGGFEFTVLEAPIKDLTNTVWGHERHAQILFVSDAFQYLHFVENDEALHKPGQCRLMSSELPALPTVEQAQRVTVAALAWTRYTDADQYIDHVVRMLERYPSQLIAPTHGNVIDDLGAILPIMRDAYRRPLSK
jgi:flavorubredoxin